MTFRFPDRRCALTSYLVTCAHRTRIVSVVGGKLEACPTLGLAVAALALCVAMALCGGVESVYAQAGFGIQPGGATGSSGFEHGTYLPTERTLERGLAEAQTRIAAGEYSAAVAFLQGILERDEDSFTTVPDNLNRYAGVKAVARRMIAELPPEGLAAYRLGQEAVAQRELQSAIERGDEVALGRVVRRYFHTPAGYEAALLVAQAELDRGHAASAARIHQQLLDTPAARNAFGGQLFLLAAASHLAAGNRPRATELLEQAVDGRETGDLLIAGNMRRLTDGTPDALAQVDAALAKSCASPRGESDWYSLRGSPTRNAEYPGGPPHMRPRWRARVVNHPRLESYLQERHRELTRAGLPLIPVGTALAVGDVVLFKTPREVVAVDWRSGNRIWETRSHGDPELERLSRESEQGSIESDMAALGYPLDERVWNDSLAAALASDGERVFTIRDLPASGGRQRYRGNALALGGQYLVFGSLTNRLSAYELATEGKLVWEIDGRRARDGMSGAFFLGAPLAVDGALYILAEIKSAVYLVVLDAESGELRWKQPLVSLERGVPLDPLRARGGPEPSYAEGILVCPTSAGAVVAIDLLTRSLAWAHLYARDDPWVDADTRVWNPQPKSSRELAASGWTDGSALISDGRVVLSPRDSSELFCLDLLSGEVLWRRERQDGLYVAGIDQGTVLIVRESGVTGLRLTDGEPAWEDSDIALPEEGMAAGRGLISEGSYFLPTTSGGIVAIDMATGEMRTAAEPVPDRLLGNLICHRGAVLSQSPLSIDKFDQRSLLLERTTAALARNDRDPAALRDRGEIALANGEDAVAAEYLKRAHEIDPSDLLTQELLTESLLGLLAADYAAYRQEVPLLATLIDDPQTRFELLRLQADGLLKLGQTLEAFNILVELAESEATLTDLNSVSPHRKVRGDRWLQARLVRLMNEAADDDRTYMNGRLAEVRGQLDETTPFTRLTRHIARFDGTPGAGEVWLKLVQQLLARQEYLKAELALLRLTELEDPHLRAAALGLTCELLRAPESAGDWKHYITQLADLDPNTMVLDNRTVGEWITELTADRNEDNEPDGNWAQNKISVELARTTGRGERERALRAARDSPLTTPLRLEQLRHRHLGSEAYFVSNDLDELIVHDPWGEEYRRIRLEADADDLPNRRNDRQTVYGARVGHLLVLSLGREVLAIDTRVADDSGVASVLWRRSLISQRSGASVTGRLRHDPGPYSDLAGRKRLVDARKRVIGSLGPVTPRAVVVHDGEALVSLEPLTGSVLWSRSDVPVGCELFGDEQMVIAKPPQQEELLVYDLLDGRKKGTRPLPEGQWLVTAGRNLATIQSHPSHDPIVSVTDVWNGSELLRESYPVGTRMLVNEPDALAVVQPTGRFRWIDISTGKVVMDRPLEPEARLKDLYVMRDRSRLFVITNKPAQRRPETRVTVAETNFPLVTGSIYAFDLESGDPLWDQPAEIVEEGIAVSQPVRSPLLVFASRINVQQRSRGTTSRLRLLCLDKETGRPVYENDALDDGPGGRFHVVVERGDQPTVMIQTPITDVRLTLTDTPISLEETTGNALPTDAPDDDAGQESALWKLGGQLGKQVLEALENARNQNRAEPQPVPAEPKETDTGDGLEGDDVHDD